ncbi:MAG: flagellar hook-basal body complex protein FliE [Thermodesulfobacteriota bacterium]
MVDSIKGVLIGQKEAFGRIAESASNGGDTFGTVLKDSLEKVNGLQKDANKAIEGLATGEVANVHDTMIAIEKANISFNLMVQVRNKLVQAYEEIMRTQV